MEGQCYCRNGGKRDKSELTHYRGSSCGLWQPHKSAAVAVINPKAPREPDSYGMLA
jgi:hypothetical protein